MTNDELDRLAGEKVMGWEQAEGNCGVFWRNPNHPNNSFFMFADMWQPTRNIAQAWEMLEKFTEPEISRSGNWICSVEMPPSNGERICVLAETAPLSIVLACLKAKGVEV